MDYETDNDQANKPRDDNERDADLRNYLLRVIEEAYNGNESEVSETREQVFNRYYGKHRGDEEEGKSKMHTREVYETTEWALPSIVRVFTSHELPVEFEPLNEQDEDRVAIETEIVHHIITQKNPGFLNYATWFKDCLLNPNAYAKVWAEEKVEVEIETMTGVDMQSAQMLLSNPDTEVVEYAKDVKSVFDPQQGGFVEVDVYELNLRHTRRDVQIKIAPLPPEESLIDAGLHTLDCDEAEITAHRRKMSVSDLFAMGYDLDALDAVGPSQDGSDHNAERINRLFYEDESPESNSHEEQDSGPQRQLWVHECSVKYDYDEDHIAERRRVVMVGDEIFENEGDMHQPIIAIASVLVPHKHICMSYAESVIDLQDTTTTLLRQMLDNVYAQTDKRHFFDENALTDDNATMNQYLDARSKMIITDGPPAGAVMPEDTPPVINELLAVLQFFQDKGQVRSGVAPTLSLDPNVLKDSTMGAFREALNEANQRLELLVRLLAETGVKKLYQKVHALMRRHMNTPISLKIRGRWQTVTPSEWPQRTEIKVNVGTGQQSKQMKVQMLFQLLGIQKEAMASGLTDLSRVYKTLSDLVELADLGDGNSRFIDPKTPEFTPPQPPPPDPVMVAQVEHLRANTQKIQSDAQRAGAESMSKLQLEFQRLRDDQERFAKEFVQKQTELERRYGLDAVKTASELANTDADTRNKDIDGDKAELELSDAVAEVEDAIDSMNMIDSGEFNDEGNDDDGFGPDQSQPE